MGKKFYVTTAIDYTNDVIHIGQAYQKVVADVFARWYRLLGKRVFFLTGTDEHGKKIYEIAKERGLNPKEFVDVISTKDKEEQDSLNISYDRFIRTTDKDHEKIVQEVTKKILKKGDIYKGIYEGLYCVGCEAYLTEKDLSDGKCPVHDKKPEVVKEETYFFRLSKYKKKLLKYYEKHPEFILPEERRNEIISKVKEGVKDLSITRTTVSWGIPFPGDEKHTIYVWWDALLNYFSGIYSEKKFWPPDLQLLGKDNGWFHGVVWPAMLMSAGLKLPKKIFIHGFLTFEGKKISKSLGNIIHPKELVKKYGSDSVRYFLCRNFALGQDGDFNEKALVRRHNSELADKLGNLVSRVTALAEQYGIEKCKNRLLKELNIKEIVKCFENFKIDKVLNIIFEFIDKCNLYVQQNELWKTKDKKKIYELCDSIKAIAILLWPFIPSAAEKIAEHFNFEIKNLKQINKRLKTEKIKKIEILFKKLEENTLDKIKKEKIQEGKMENISFEEWKRIDLRIGRITSVKKHPNADKLFILEVDLGALGKRNIVAGLQGHYSEKDLNGKYCVVLVNLEPKEIRGVKSEGMLLAAVNESCVILLVPEKEINPGSKVE